MSEELEPIFETELENYKQVVLLAARGKTPAEIQRETGIIPRQQRKILEQFEDYANNDFQTQRRAKTIVAELDVQYTHIIRELEAVVEEAESEGDWRLKKDTLKELANVNKMRAEQLQKAGILSSEVVGAQISQMQREREEVVKLLKEVSQQCKTPETQHIGEIIRAGLIRISNEVQGEDR